MGWRQSYMIREVWGIIHNKTNNMHLEDKDANLLKGVLFMHLFTFTH